MQELKGVVEKIFANDPEMLAIAQAPRKPRIQFGEAEIANNDTILREILALNREAETYQGASTREEIEAARDRLMQIRLHRETLSEKLLREERGVAIGIYSRNHSGYVPPISIYKVCHSCKVKAVLSKNVLAQILTPNPCKQCGIKTSWAMLGDSRVADYELKGKQT